uniref:Putative GPI-anchored protein At3g06035 n=1 Tax=Anthurium amnicola TaxID=1678845 RepID=A0A1D1YHE2_9ARAE
MLTINFFKELMALEFRVSLKLSTLTENQNAACLADQSALQLENQECTNATGANTAPATEEQISHYPDMLTYCHLNATVTQDGAILPACMPGLAGSEHRPFKLHKITVRRISE